MNQRFWVLGAGFWVLVLSWGFVVRPDVAVAQPTPAEYEALKNELLAMREADQKFRDIASLSINPTLAELALIKEQEAIDRANMERLGQIVKTSETSMSAAPLWGCHRSPNT